MNQHKEDAIKKNGYECKNNVKKPYKLVENTSRTVRENPLLEEKSDKDVAD